MRLSKGVATAAAGLAAAGLLWVGSHVRRPIESTVAAVQGTGAWSPLEGRLVAVEGVVTAVAKDGYWLADGDAGVRVAADRAGARVGRRLRVTGMVAEVVRGNSLDESETVIEQRGEYRDLGSGAVEPVALGAWPTVGTAAEIHEWWEPYEGRLVRIAESAVVGPRSRHGEVFVVGAGEAALWLEAKTGLPPALAIDNRIAEMPAAAVGDSIGETVGPVGYGYGAWRVSPTATPTVTDGGLRREATTLRTDDDGVTVASYNVQNLHGESEPTRIASVAADLADGLGLPAVVALQEIQDNNGPAPGPAMADRTYRALLAALPRGVTYRVTQVDPVDGRDGGQPHGNIRCALLWQPGLVNLVARGNSDAAAAVRVLPAGGIEPSPGVLAPTHRAFAGARKPLVAWFRVRGRDLVVIAVHLSSKFGDSPYLGKAQPPLAASAAQRLAQVALVAEFVREVRRAWPAAEVLVLGDCNDLPDSPALSPWSAAELVHLTARVPHDERYSYVYKGVRQLLDQAWGTAGLADGLLAADVVRLNAPFPDSGRASDHDPVILKLAFETKE